MSQSLRYLRKALQSGTIVSQGEEEVGIDRAFLRCDVSFLEDAMEAGDYQAAAGIYRGPFFEGFFVADASQAYDEWVAAERTRLQDFALQALRYLSQHALASGNLHESIRWARRAISTVPDSELPVADLLRVLIQSGDHLGALREYERHRARLHAELGISPSPIIEELVRAVRAP